MPLRLTNFTTSDMTFGLPTTEVLFSGTLNAEERAHLAAAFSDGPVYLDLAGEPANGKSTRKEVNNMRNVKLVNDFSAGLFKFDLCGTPSKKEPLFGGAWYVGGKLTYITRVLYNDPATVVFWNDGTKTVAKCAKEDKYSKETGLAMAILKKLLGNAIVSKTFADWLPTDEKTKSVDLTGLRAKKRAVEKAAKPKKGDCKKCGRKDTCEGDGTLCETAAKEAAEDAAAK